MPSMKYSQLLARVNFPLYTVQCLSNRYILVAGGGGSAKTGIRNAIEVYELINNGRTCRAEPVAHYETGNEAIMNCTVFNAGKYSILFTGKEGNCQVYKVRHDVVEDNKGFEHNSDKKAPYPRKRNIHDSASSVSEVKSSESNANEHELCFKINPLESFQTDFSEEPFQKLVKFFKVENLLATGGADGHIRLWKHPKLNQMFDIEAHKDDVDDMDFCPSGNKIVSVSRDGHGKVWNTQDGSLITELECFVPIKCEGRYIFRSCRFGIVEDKNNVALFTTMNPAVRKKPHLKCYLCKYETKNFTVVKTVSTGTDMSSTMAISDDGQFIGLGCQSGSIKIFIAFSLQLLYNVESIHGIFVTSVQFLPSTEESRRITGGHETSLISVSVDNRIIIHHIPMRTSMSIFTLIILFILTLFLVFLIMDFINL